MGHLRDGAPASPRRAQQLSIDEQGTPLIV
jgi:hypothetical protein